VYKDYIKLLVNRYKCSSAIFAWELGNEPRCHGCPTSVIYNWATEISQYIKSLDSKHMVTLGDEGWFAPADNIGDGSYAYSGAEGVDFSLNLGIETLDYVCLTSLAQCCSCTDLRPGHFPPLPR
jgi:mannan endo-1,4-beta-mannosidase